MNTTDEKLVNRRNNELTRIKGLNDTQRMCPLITDNPNRFVVLPIKFEKTWNLYKEMQSSVWMVEDYNFDLFVDHYHSNCTKLERKYIASVLKRVGDFDTATINCILLEILQYPEARSIYGWTASQDYQIQELATLILKDLINDDEFKENFDSKMFDDRFNSSLVFKNWQDHIIDDAAVTAERFLSHVILKFGILINFCLIRAITLEDRDIIFKKLIESIINDIKMSLMVFTSLKASFFNCQTDDDSFTKFLIDKLLKSEFQWIYKTSQIQIKHQNELVNSFIKFVTDVGDHTLDVKFVYDKQSACGFSVKLHNIGVEIQNVPKLEKQKLEYISFDDEESF